MSEEDKPARKRGAQTRLLISEESKARLRARLESEEGQRCLDKFAKLIAEWAANVMPTELIQALGTHENLDTLKELWPDIVDAYFKALSNPAPRK